MQNKRFTLVFLMLLGPLCTTTADATGACDLNGKTITAKVQACPGGRSSPACSLIPTRTVFLKDKILYYDSPTDETGTVFYPDQTVNALTDPNQNRKLYDQYLRQSQRLSASIPLTATITDDVVTLDYSIRTHRNPSVTSDWNGSGWLLKVRFPNCYSCEVTDYKEYDHVAGRAESVTKILTRQSCQLN